MDGRWFDLPAESCSAACEEGPGSTGRAERTRARLVRTAARCFAEAGYHGTALRDVLDEAGATKGALYFHFDSKAELARAVCDEASRSWSSLLTVLALRGLDPLQEMLVQGDATLLRFADDLPLRAALRVGAEAAELDGMLVRWRAGWEERTTVLFDRARDDGLLLGWARPQTLGRHVVALMLGHQSFATFLPPPDDDPWTRMNEAWDGVLSATTTRPWQDRWRASGWHGRERPRRVTEP